MSPFVVPMAVLGLVAGGLPLLVASPSGGQRPGLAVQAPGSSGSARSLPWWDPWGWFGGDSGTPRPTVLADNAAAVPSAGRLPRQAALGPVHRVRELPSRRTEFSRTYALSDGRMQAAVSAGPVNFRTASGNWAPISTTVARSSRPGYAFENVTNTFGSYFGSSAGNLIRLDAPGGGWLQVGLPGARVGMPVALGNTVTYRSVAPGVSLSYEVTPKSLTERISVASAAAARSLPALRFVIQAGGGLTPQAQLDGSILT